MQDPPPSNEGGFTNLMQFSDGNRIDLGIYPITKMKELRKDSLSLILLDKDGIIESFPPASEREYLPKQLKVKAYSDYCNEFWWVCPYVAKGLWRGKIIFAKYMFDQVAREQLLKMLTWYIGEKTQFSRNPGKFGKYSSIILSQNCGKCFKNHMLIPTLKIHEKPCSQWAIFSELQRFV